MSHQRTVYVIDDDPSVRRALASHLGGLGVEAWPFAGGLDFLAIVDHLVPSCVLLDMEMPGQNGLDILGELARKLIDWPVIGLSASGELAVAVKAMKLGTIDFLQKPVTQEMLEAALAPAWTALQHSIRASDMRRTAQERVAKLTPREMNIAMGLLSGQSNKMAAYHFGISIRTVEMHRAHIMAKLGVRSLAEAGTLAAQAGMSPGMQGDCSAALATLSAETAVAPEPASAPEPPLMPELALTSPAPDTGRRLHSWPPPSR